MYNIEVNKISVSIKEEGTGEPIVLLHSSVNSGEQWKAAFESFADEFHVLAPDLIGYGGTDPWPGRGTLALADEVALVDTVVSQLHKPVHLIGHSYGGAVALRMAIQRPDRIQSLCLIEPVALNVLNGTGEEERYLFNEIVELSAVVIDLQRAGCSMEAARVFVDYWSGEGTLAGLPAGKRHQIAEYMHKVVLDFHAIITEPTPVSAYGRIDVPTLVLCGTHSPKPTRYITRLLAEVIPDARHRTIPHAGHMLPVTHPIHVNAAVRTHLMRVYAMSKRQAA